MKRTRDTIRTALPWAILNKTVVANRIIDALVCNGIIVATACPAYACNGGWQYDGVAVDRSCPTCDGIGWIAPAEQSPSASEVHATLTAEAAEQRSHDREGGK